MEDCMLKAIIFDAYGTLFNTGNGSVEACKAILDKNNSLIDPVVFYSTWKKYQREHIDSLPSFIKQEDIFLLDLKRLYKKYSINGNAVEDVRIMLSILGKRSVFEDTVEVINLLRKKYKVFIGSISDDAPLFSDIERNGVVVDGVYTSESLKAYKPQKKFFLKLLESIEMKPDEVIYVGDSLFDDVYGAGTVGIDSVWINRKKQMCTNMQRKPTYEIKNLYELSGVLEYYSKLTT